MKSNDGFATAEHALEKCDVGDFVLADLVEHVARFGRQQVRRAGSHRIELGFEILERQREVEHVDDDTGKIVLTERVRCDGGHRNRHGAHRQSSRDARGGSGSAIQLCGTNRQTLGERRVRVDQTLWGVEIHGVMHGGAS